MPYSTIRRRRPLFISLLLLGSTAAEAQISPGGMPGGGMGGPQQGEEPKKEGVAEAAPKTPGLLPTTPALPAPKGRRKRWKLFEIDGYFRTRTDWFKNFNLGFTDDPALGGAPFPRALGCATGELTAPCEESLSSATMRLRLEPTINLSEGTSVHIQADLLDNVVLGSTPLNEIYNGAAYDPFSGNYDLDSDYGDNVDRASFTAPIPGTPLRAMIATDWASTRFVSNQTNAGFGREGHPWDLDDKDDSTAYVAVISRLDSPTEFKDKVDRGELALNYGVYFEYRSQEWDTNTNGAQVGSAPDIDGADDDVYVFRGMKQYSPDIWFKLAYKRIQLEGEVIAQLGSIASLDDYIDNLTNVDIRKYGGTGRFTWKGLEGKLRLGVESGAASGDQWDSKVPGRINVVNRNELGNGGLSDRKLSQFIFDREYRIDMILWRHLVGGVTNAGYVKPFLGYDISKSIGFKVANITSYALKTVATPGNSRMYGTEFNASIGYTNNGLNAFIAYGVLFPFAALSHPASTATTDYGFSNDATTGVQNVGEASTAHMIQMNLALMF